MIYLKDVMKLALKLMVKYWNGSPIWTNSQKQFYTLGNLSMNQNGVFCKSFKIVWSWCQFAVVSDPFRYFSFKCLKFHSNFDKITVCKLNKEERWVIKASCKSPRNVYFRFSKSENTRWTGFHWKPSITGSCVLNSIRGIYLMTQNKVRRQRRLCPFSR